MCGRALTLLWKEVVSVLAPREIISMSDLLHRVRSWTQQADPGAKWEWVEYDIKEMFPEIPRHEILNALTGLKSMLAGKRRTRGPLNFFMSRDRNRKLDNMTGGAACHFLRLTFHDALHVVLYDLQLNDLFLCLTSVLSQNTGIPIGGPMSAQLASLTLIYRELVQPLPWGLQHTMWVRYRDNFLFMMLCMPGVNQNVVLESYRQELEILTSMQITLEQSGQSLQFLECQLENPHGPHPITLPNFLHQEEKPSSPAYVKKLIDGEALNWPTMVASLVPNMVKKAFHYRLNHSSLRLNLNRLSEFFMCKYGAKPAWSDLLRSHTRKWQ